MKICIINNLYPPLARGGAEQVVEKTVEALLEAGHSVVLVTLSGEKISKYTHRQSTQAPKHESTKALEHLSTKAREHESTLSLWTFSYRPKNLFFYTDAHRHSFFARLIWHIVDMFHFGSARFVRGVLEEEQPDVVHTHNLMGLGFLIPRAIRRLHIRHVHTVHDVQLVEPSGIILKQQEDSFRYKGFPTRMYVWMMRRLMGSPDVVISPSNFLLDFYGKWKFFPKSEFVQLRNPMTFGLRRQQTTDSRQQSHEIFRFFYIGQVEEHKGVRFLVETFRRWIEDMAASNNPSSSPLLEGEGMIELHIVGDGSKLEEIRQCADGCEQVVIHGRVGRDALPALFEQADMVIAPSLCYENSPTVIFESFAFGVPVLASNIEGIAELIEEGENGLTFAAGDVDSLKEKLRWCVSHREDVKRMGERTSEFLEEFSVEGYVGELEGWYHSSSSKVDAR